LDTKADDIVADRAGLGEGGCVDEVVGTVVCDHQKRLRRLNCEVINDYPTKGRTKS
jgi:hypothetical protein